MTRLNRELWKGVTVSYLPYYNIRRLSNLFQMFSASAEMVKIKKEKDAFVLLDALNISLGLGVSLACKVRRIKMVVIVTDLPEYTSEDSNLLFMSQCRKIIGRCSGYVFLTEAMNDFCNPMRRKPYVVIEGQADSDMGKVDNRLEGKYEKKSAYIQGTSIG